MAVTTAAARAAGAIETGAVKKVAKKGLLSLLGPAAGTALTGVAPWLKAALGIWMVGDLIKGGYGLHSASKEVDTQTELAKMKIKADQQLAETENAANQQATNQYLAMLADMNKRETTERSQDRQMQYLMAILAGTQNLGQQAVQAGVQARLPAPPMAMTSLLRGLD